MAEIVALWRHPIKSHGREAMDELVLTAGQTLPFDRRWAVVHDASDYDLTAPEWAPCQNFMLGTRISDLAAIWARVDEAAGRVTLRHPQLGEITFDPDDSDDAEGFIAWVGPLCPDRRARPRAVVRVPGRGMTDTDYPSVSVMNVASHAAVAESLDRPLETERWRGNIWIDGLEPWAEAGWPGRRLRIGAVELAVREPIVRCLHTAANPHTGARDADTLGTLDRLTGRREFGVYAEIVTGGTLRPGDRVEVMA